MSTNGLPFITPANEYYCHIPVTCAAKFRAAICQNACAACQNTASRLPYACQNSPAETLRRLPNTACQPAKMLAPPAKIPPRACHMPAKTRLPRPCADCQNTACLNTACQRANMLIPFPAHACREETRLPLACRRLPKRASCQGTLSPDLSDRYQLECHQTCPVACSRVMGQCCLIPRSALQVAGAAGNKRRNAVPGRD